MLPYFDCLCKPLTKVSHFSLSPLLLSTSNVLTLRVHTAKKCVYSRCISFLRAVKQRAQNFSQFLCHTRQQTRLSSQTTITDCLSLLEKKNTRLCFSELDVPKHNSIKSVSRKDIHRLLTVELENKKDKAVTSLHAGVIN